MLKLILLKQSIRGTIYQYLLEINFRLVEMILNSRKQTNINEFAKRYNFKLLDLSMHD